MTAPNFPNLEICNHGIIKKCCAACHEAEQSLGAARGSEARARIDDAVRKVWLAYRDASDVNADMLTEQDMELWGIVTRHRAIQDRLNATIPNTDYPTGIR